MLALLLLAAAAGPVPRYALAPGLELRYAVADGNWFDGKDGRPEVKTNPDGSPKYTRHDLTVVVAAANPDGSFRTVLATRGFGGEPVLSAADLFTDGRVRWTPALMPLNEQHGLRAVFPRLPADPAARAASWADEHERTATRVSYTADGSGRVVGEWAGPLDRVAGGRLRATYTLAADTALPERVREDGYWPAYKETQEREITLREVVRHDAEWAGRFAAEADRYFAAVTANRRALSWNNRVPLAEAARTPAGAGPLLDAGRKVLAAAAEQAAEPLFQDALTAAVKQDDRWRESRLEGADRWGKLAGRPAPGWEAADLDGNPHSQAGYRGKVLVLDFWFRQCNYCIRLMPQVERAAAHFRRAAAPVAFLGVSTDQADADARHVADTVKLTAPVVRSKAVAEAFGVTSFPTLLVVGPDGAVRGIFSGSYPTLQEDLIACVEAVLGAGTPPPPPSAPRPTARTPGPASRCGPSAPRRAAAPGTPPPNRGTPARSWPLGASARTGRR